MNFRDEMAVNFVASFIFKSGQRPLFLARNAIFVKFWDELRAKIRENLATFWPIGHFLPTFFSKVATKKPRVSAGFERFWPKTHFFFILVAIKIF